MNVREILTQGAEIKMFPKEDLNIALELILKRRNKKDGAKFIDILNTLQKRDYLTKNEVQFYIKHYRTRCSSLSKKEKICHLPDIENVLYLPLIISSLHK